MLTKALDAQWTQFVLSGTGRPSPGCEIIRARAFFPSFVRNPANRIAASSQYTNDIDGYVFDGADGEPGGAMEVQRRQGVPRARSRLRRVRVRPRGTLHCSGRWQANRARCERRAAHPERHASSDGRLRRDAHDARLRWKTRTQRERARLTAREIRPRESHGSRRNDRRFDVRTTSKWRRSSVITRSVSSRSASATTDASVPPSGRSL